MDVAFAISDPVRRSILMLLRTQPMAAGEIAEYFDISRPAVSRHLRVLRKSGLAVSDVIGRMRVYRIDTTPLHPLQEWISMLQQPWSAAMDALETEVYRTRRERRVSSRTNQEKSA